MLDWGEKEEEAWSTNNCCVWRNVGGKERGRQGRLCVLGQQTTCVYVRVCVSAVWGAAGRRPLTLHWHTDLDRLPSQCHHHCSQCLPLPPCCCQCWHTHYTQVSHTHTGGGGYSTQKDYRLPVTVCPCHVCVSLWDPAPPAVCGSSPWVTGGAAHRQSSHLGRCWWLCVYVYVGGGSTCYLSMCLDVGTRQGTFTMLPFSCAETCIWQSQFCKSPPPPVRGVVRCRGVVDSCQAQAR